VSFDRSINIRGRKEDARVPLAPINLALNPGNLLFFSRQRIRCYYKRGPLERERGRERWRRKERENDPKMHPVTPPPSLFVKEDRAHAAVALSAPASPAINPPLLPCVYAGQASV